MASTTRVSAAAERRRAGNLLQASVADGMGFSDHATIVARRNDCNSPAGAAGSVAVTTCGEISSARLTKFRRTSSRPVMSFQFSLYDALVSVDVPPDKARAVIDALERDMGATLETKSDVRLLQRGIDQLRKDVERDLELLRSSMTVRLGSIQVVTAGLLFAALKLT